MAILRIKDEAGNIISIPAIKGEPGKSAYEYAKDGGYTGTEEEFKAKLALENPTREEFSQLQNTIIKNPTSATIGQILEVGTVDDSGKPTSWKAVDKPTGGSTFIDVTKPPKEYTGTPISTESEDNGSAFYDLIMWVLSTYTEPVLCFPSGEYKFSTRTQIQPVFEERKAKKIRVTGNYNVTINWTVGQSAAREGWLEFFYKNTVETYNNFSVEIDHFNFVRTVELEDDIHSNFQWIWVYGSQLADVWMDIVNIHHCRFEGQCGGAILIGYARQLFVEYNYFYNCYEATSNDDSGFIVHVGQTCKNAVVRKNYMYVDDTKQLCGGGIVSEYQTGCCEIVDNYVYGYDRGIHIELTQEDGAQIIRSNHVENCVDGIVVWNALSDTIIDGNRIIITDTWDYTDRVAYSENGFSGIRFPTYARNKSVKIINNTVRLKYGAPISNTAGGNYSNIYYYPKNWEIAYNTFECTELRSHTFYCPIYSDIHHNKWTINIFNVYGAYKTNIHHNAFNCDKFYQQVSLGASIKYIAQDGTVIAESLQEYLDNYDTGLRGTTWLEKYACKIYDNYFTGVNGGYCNFNSSNRTFSVIMYNNEIHHSGDSFMFTSCPTTPPTQMLNIAYNNIAYLYNGATLSANTSINGVSYGNKIYSVDSEGLLTSVFNELDLSITANQYRGLMNPNTGAEVMKNNIAFIMPMIPSDWTNGKYTQGEYLVGDVCYNSKWTPNTDSVYYWVCTTAGKGAATEEGDAVAVWGEVKR